MVGPKCVRHHGDKPDAAAHDRENPTIHLAPGSGEVTSICLLKTHCSHSSRSHWIFTSSHLAAPSCSAIQSRSDPARRGGAPASHDPAWPIDRPSGPGLCDSPGTIPRPTHVFAVASGRRHLRHEDRSLPCVTVPRDAKSLAVCLPEPSGEAVAGARAKMVKPR